mmetsp:Transcript_18354/g.43151  ORF Transcript_18354/g.43151 Transcript_18354/m.43151 type:complete len:240 (+) Transcript_18354:374-1093(+)
MMRSSTMISQGLDPAEVLLVFPQLAQLPRNQLGELLHGLLHFPGGHGWPRGDCSGQCRVLPAAHASSYGRAVAAPRQLLLMPCQALELIIHLPLQLPHADLQVRRRPSGCLPLQRLQGCLAGREPLGKLREPVRNVLALLRSLVVAAQEFQPRVQGLDGLLQLLLHRCYLLLTALHALHDVSDAVNKVTSQQFGVRQVLVVASELVHAHLKGPNPAARQLLVLALQLPELLAQRALAGL